MDDMVIDLASKRNGMTIGTWNVWSSNTSDYDIAMELKRHKIEIFATTETKKKRIKGYENYILVNSSTGKEKRVRERVYILLHRKY